MTWTPSRPLLAALLIVVGLGMGAPVAASEPAFFSERVAPVLRKRCIECHNATRSRGGLSLASRPDLLRGGDQGAVIVPGKSGASRLVKLVSGDKPAMPRKGGPLTPEQIADIRKWIDDGAAWPENVTLSNKEGRPVVDASWWSLRPLERPVVPVVKTRGWVRNPVDAFVLATLETTGLRPAPEADRATLIRRLTFDLHGLPPSPEEIDAFVADSGPRAYERLVERLLASPRHGERWGRHWLDIVHYADTHGYDKDKRRDHAWPYRDYVIRAFNSDKPYPRFIREQLAGDFLYPEADGTVASGFVTAGPWDFVGHVELREGTVDKMKTRLLDRDDMVSSTMSTFVSMTVHCARCHDHKFDPIPQQDYYALQAVFAGVERGNRPYDPPEPAARRAGLARRQKELEAHRAELAMALDRLSSPELVQLDAALQRLRRDLAALPSPTGKRPSPTNGYHSTIVPRPDARKWVQVDLGASLSIEVVRLIPARPTDFPDTPGFGFPARFRVDVSDDPTFAKCEAIADHTAADFPNPGDKAFVVRLAGKKARFVRVTAEKLWPRTNDYVFALAELQVESSGKNVALGKPVIALDSIEAGRWSRRHLVDNFDSRRELPDATNPATAAVLQKRSRLEAEIRQAETKRHELRQQLLDPSTRAAMARNATELADVVRQSNALPPPGQVYAVLSISPRPIHVLPRGDVEKSGPPAVPGSLRCVSGLSPAFRLADRASESVRRAALAEWIADPKNPLTWRSIANRVWQYHFGRGLVDTPNDFGGNGARPTHPELLDWLACEVRDNGGSLKKLHRLIVTSAAYRQSSRHDEAMAKLDADNRYLWRMNRQRLDAESVRDGVLAVSGTLDLKMGGAGFELFRFKDDHSPVYDHTALEKIHDPATYRRTVYRFTVRSVPNPFLDCLDCADPNINTPVRNTTLTALQALALLNNPFMMRQSEFFAERLRKTRDPVRQIERGFMLAFGRLPTAEERDAFVAHGRKHGLVSACRLLFNANEFVFVD